MTDEEGVRSAVRRAGRPACALAVAAVAGCSMLGDSLPGGGECTEAERAELRTRIDTLEAELEDRAAVDPAEEFVARGLELMVEQLEEGFPAETIETAERVGREARESVLVLEVWAGGEVVGGGTGWYVDESHVATNAHVVFDGTLPDAITGYTVDGDELSLDVVEYVEGRQPDVALLSASRTGPPLATASEADLETGRPLVQVGHPTDVGYWVISLGQFASRFEIVADDRYTELNTLVRGREGVSGSPLLTLDGAVVGMTTGEEPMFTRESGDEPVHAPEVLYDVPLAVIGISKHVGVDVVRRLHGRWT